MTTPQNMKYAIQVKVGNSYGWWRNFVTGRRVEDSRTYCERMMTVWGIDGEVVPVGESTPQNITTEDLLGAATARPWNSNAAQVLWGDFPVADCETGNPPANDETNAELIARAVNSFESMRDALTDLVKIYCPAQAGDATIAAWIKAVQALAIANGKQP